MGFAFTDILINIFDAHPAVQAAQAQSPKYFQPGFDFLINEQRYDALYRSSNVVKTKSFEFRPLPLPLMMRHFWGRYASIQNGLPWKAQLPLVSESNNINLKLAFKIPGIKLGIRSAVYLSPIGWSTKISVRLQGFIKNRDLIKTVNSISNKIPEQIPFSIEGKTYNITELFRHFQNLLLEEVYSKDKPPHLGMQIERHIVVSLNKFEGSPVNYETMTKADQALMRGILFGQEVDAAMEINSQGQANQLKPIVVTNPYNFALTEFNYGTLIFLQRHVQDPSRKAAIHCFATNVSNCIIMILALSSFYKSAKSSDKETPLGMMSTQAKNNLCGLPKAYPNQVCQYYFLNHNYLSALCSTN